MNYIETYNYTNTGSLDVITTFLEGKENYILNNYDFLGDFGTKLTEEHVSTRSGGYNIFHMVNECAELSDLLNFISTSYYHYIDNILPNKTFENSELDPAVMCWLNVLRNSENIGMHKHAEDHGDLWSIISGTFVLRASHTNTHYSHDGESESIYNLNGQLTIFPPYYNHWTDLHTITDARLTLGMDFFFKKEHASGDSSFYNNLVNLTTT